MSQGAVPTRTQDIKQRDNHSDSVLFLSIQLINTELTTSVWYSMRVQVKVQTFQIVSKWIFDTSKHYKLNHKHITEVSTDMWNCLIEFEWMEDIACLSRTHSSRFKGVSDHIKTEYIQSKNKENWQETYLMYRRYEVMSPSDLAVQQTQYQ